MSVLAKGKIGGQFVPLRGERTMSRIVPWRPGKGYMGVMKGSGLL
jgi:hypothetical protein